MNQPTRRRTCLNHFALILALAIALHETATAGGTFIYCSAAEDKAIAVYRLNEKTGELSLVEREPTPGQPGVLVASPDRTRLFASMRSTGQLAGFHIDSTTGRLTSVNVVDGGEDPAHLYVDKSGDHLFTAYYVAAKIGIHRIDDNGNLSRSPVQEVKTEKRAHAVGPDPAERFFYVPHTKPNRIYQFTWDRAESRLAPHETPFIQRPDRSGPRHMVWHPNHPIAYIDNEQGSSVTAYQIGETGSLIAGQTASTIPANFEGPNSNATLRMHPNGRFLYVANRGHDSLALIELDETGKHLKLVDTYSTEKTPRSFAIEPGGKFLFSAGENSGRLAIFTIDSDAGHLRRIQTYPIGRKFWWVEAIRTSK